jgi:four helix bundle protein
MFDFEKLEVYQQFRGLNQEVLKCLFSDLKMDPYLKDQLKRATISGQVNLAEGVGRMSDADKKHYFTMARGSVFEAVALLQILTDIGQLDPSTAQGFYDKYEGVSKMLLGLYRSK